MSMKVLDDREKAFEAKFHVDQEVAFKVNSRRDKLLGLWVAEMLGLSGTAAEDYAKSVVIADLEEPGDDDVVRKVMKDLGERGVQLDEAKLRHQMDKLLVVAKQQIMTEVPA